MAPVTSGNNSEGMPWVPAENRRKLVSGLPLAFHAVNLNSFYIVTVGALLILL